MNELQVKKSNISQWLLCTSKVPNEWETFFEYELPEYLNRVYAIDKKIKSLLEKLSVLSNGEELLWAGDKLQEVYSIRKSIGVYHVPGVIESNTFLKFQYPLWVRYSKEYKAGQTTYRSGWEWMDYFGDRKITDRDTCLIVSLSDEGVSYLNEIASKVSSYITAE
jgi:hypothetical protein